MFSSRTPSDLAPNRLSQAIAALKAQGRPFIDLTESNPTCAAIDYPADLLASLADPRGLRYAPQPFGVMDARVAAARTYASRGLEVSAHRVMLTASTSEAYSVLFKLLADAGDEVLVPRPSYPLFDHLTRLDLVDTRHYDLEYHGRWSIDMASVERAITSRTRAILLVSPNNPTGSYVRRDELAQLAALAANRDIALIADEVFNDYELTDGASTLAASLMDAPDVLGFSLGGLSKAAGLPQMKLAWAVVSGPDWLVEPALKRLELICDTYLSVSTPVQVAASALIERGAIVRDRIRARVRDNYARLCSRVGGAPACCVLPAEGGWYAVVRVPSFESEDALVVSLLEQDAVLVHPGYFFDFPRESLLVVSLLPPVDRFADGIGRIVRRFETAGGAR